MMEIKDDRNVKVDQKNSNLNHEKKKEIRERYGRISSIVGVIINIILFIGKFTVGFLTGSVSITGDAMNNLSPAHPLYLLSVSGWRGNLPIMAIRLAMHVLNT
jgi:Co/Zn/Cd efflux system component